MERHLLAEYEGDLDLIERSLAPDKIDAAAALASVPALIRGYGHVKQANARQGRRRTRAPRRPADRSARKAGHAGRRVADTPCLPDR